MSSRKYSYKELKKLLKPLIERLSKSNEFFTLDEVPFKGKLGFGAIELVRRALNILIIHNGRFVVDNIDIGLALNFRGFYGLQSTNMTGLRCIFDRLVRDLGMPAAKNALSEWERRRGITELKEQVKNEERQFTGEVFRGFD